jgi:hypothetical protein
MPYWRHIKTRTIKRIYLKLRLYTIFFLSTAGMITPKTNVKDPGEAFNTLNCLIFAIFVHHFGLTGSGFEFQYGSGFNWVSEFRSGLGIQIRIRAGRNGSVAVTHSDS